jgi:hypothetical protein
MIFLKRLVFFQTKFLHKIWYHGQGSNVRGSNDRRIYDSYIQNCVTRETQKLIKLIRNLMERPLTAASFLFSLSSSLPFLSIWSHLKIQKNTSLIYMILYIRRSLRGSNVRGSNDQGLNIVKASEDWTTRGRMPGVECQGSNFTIFDTRKNRTYYT